MKFIVSVFLVSVAFGVVQQGNPSTLNIHRRSSPNEGVNIRRRDSKPNSCFDKCDNTPLTHADSLKCYDKCDSVNLPGTCINKCASLDFRSGCDSTCEDFMKYNLKVASGYNFTKFEQCRAKCYFQTGSVTLYEVRACADKCDPRIALGSCRTACDNKELDAWAYEECYSDCGPISPV